MKKLYKNNFTVLLSSIALSSSLLACTPNKINDNQIKEEIISNAIKQANNIIKEGKNNTEILKEKNKEKEIENYIDSFKAEISELKEITKEKWNSKETQEKINNIKKKSKELFDFIFNGKEINGIKFEDLSENGKEIAKNGLYELDYYIELIIPSYKDRFKDWTVDKGADALELYDSIKNWYESYQEEVTEEYESRKK